MITLHGRARRGVAAASVLVLALACSACGSSVGTNEPLPPFTPASVDANAGSWRMVLLNGPAQINVPMPAPVTDAAYRAELTALKASQAQLTDAQRRNIEYWSGGGVLRWNQIMREVLARSDLPPAPNPDGTYPVPDPNNPFDDPRFPFGNPPYASRAYSYMSVAQYDALKVAWYYKYLYNRPAPARVDSGVQALVPATDLPAYPSEDAVMSSVNAELLRVLFPTSIEQITRSAADQREAALLSGKATASDIAAGVALGQAVAALVLAQLNTDGMRAAGGNPTIWRAMADAASARGEVPWISQDVPARPPQLPLFGRVRTWVMTFDEMVSERPGPPPSTSSAQMAAEVEEVRQTVNNITRNQLAIVHKWADGASSPTPPGHWNGIALPYIRDAKLSEVRAARAFALLNMALHNAAVASWDVKYTYFNPRPSQMDRRIEVLTGLPNFPSYTSGHSTFSAAAAVVLSYLFPQGSAFFDEQKEEAAISRLYGGIHYRSDIEVGKEHGVRLGDRIVNFAKGDGAG